MVAIGPIPQSDRVIPQLEGLSARSPLSPPVDVLVGKGTTESLPRLVYRWVFFIPKLAFTLIMKAIKDVIYVVSFCTLCRDTHNAEEMRGELEKVLETWKSPTSSTEEKRAVYAAFLDKYPGQEERIVRGLIDSRRNAQLGEKKMNDPQSVFEWNESSGPAVREEARDRLANCDPGLVSSFLRAQSETAASGTVGKEKLE